MTFPAVHLSERPTPVKTPMPSAQGKRFSILILDDVEAVAEAAACILEEDYDVEMVNTADEALERLSERKYDLLFSDIILGGEVTGIDVARKALLIDPNYKVLLMTGYAADSLERNDLPANNGFPIINKPFRREDLLRLVHQTIAGFTGVT